MGVRSQATPPMWGVDHLAFVTDDLVGTLDFYTRVLGLPLVRHGNDSLLAFFEYPKGLPRQDRDRPGGMQHLAFHVPRARFDAMVAHIRSCDVEVIGPVVLGSRFWSAYFYDNNGIRLELATSLADPSLGSWGQCCRLKTKRAPN